jgi:hypothetical protein
MTARLTLWCSMWRAQAHRAVLQGIPSSLTVRLCHGSLATSAPAKVAGLVDRTRCKPYWPTDFGGAAVCWRSDRGDGDANSFKQIPFAQKK